MSIINFGETPRGFVWGNVFSNLLKIIDTQKNPYLPILAIKYEHGISNFLNCCFTQKVIM